MDKIVSDARALTDVNPKVVENVSKPATLPVSSPTLSAPAAPWRSSPGTMEKIVGDTRTVLDANLKAAVRASAYAKLPVASSPLAVSSAPGIDSPGTMRKVLSDTGAVVESKLKASHLSSENVSLSTEAPALLVPPVNANKEKNSSAIEANSETLVCVCDGVFKAGERVKYTGHSYPSGRTLGIVLGGTTNGFVNVQWDHWSAGHDGNCKLTACGSCSVSSVTSRWFTACSDLVVQ